LDKTESSSIEFQQINQALRTRDWRFIIKQLLEDGLISKGKACCLFFFTGNKALNFLPLPQGAELIATVSKYPSWGSPCRLIQWAIFPHKLEYSL